MKIIVPLVMSLALVAQGCSKKDKVRAAEKKHAATLMKGCAEGDGISCYKLAMAAETVNVGAHIYKAQPDIIVSDVYQTAMVYLEAECASSNAASCRAAGDIYQNIGRYNTRNRKAKGEKAYTPRHAHRINPQTGKHQVASWSLSEGYILDREKAAGYYEVACGLSDALSCKELGSALTKPLVEDLIASKAAFETAVELYLSECAAGAKRFKSCDKANHILVYDINTPQSIERGLGLYKQGCEEGFARDCSYVGGIYKNDRFGMENISEAIRYFQKYCDMEKKKDCKSVQKLGG